MIDKSIIKENYSKMEDGQLIRVAQEDGHNLTAEAFQILKDDLQGENLTMVILNRQNKPKLKYMKKKSKK